MYESADNQFLADVLNHLYALSLRLWYLAADTLDDLKATIEDHRKTVAALKTRDDVQAGAMIRQHIMRFQQAIEAVL